MLSNDLREEISTGSGGSGAPRGAADGGKPSPCYKNHQVVDDKAGVAPR